MNTTVQDQIELVSGALQNLRTIDEMDEAIKYFSRLKDTQSVNRALEVKAKCKKNYAAALMLLCKVPLENILSEDHALQIMKGGLS